MEKVEVHRDPSLCKDLVIGDITFRSVLDFHLTESDLEKARKELGETEDLKKKSLEELKEMLSKDKHIRYRTDDEYLIRFLRYRKFDVKRCYKSLKDFYTMRNEDPTLFTAPSSRMEVDLERKFAYVMPYTNEDGRIVFLMRYSEWNTSEMSIRDLLTMFSYGSDILSMNPHGQINGGIVILDFAGSSKNHYAAFVNPLTLRLWTKFAQDVYPWRSKKVILLNCNSLVYAGLSIVRFFLKKKIADRLVLIRSDLNELHKHVNPLILPKEYGGCLSDDECSSYLKKVITSNQKYLDYENSFIDYRTFKEISD